eukprot:scaffold244322_cov28-Tisochrysis_lutea.AAC.1
MESVRLLDAIIADVACGVGQDGARREGAAPEDKVAPAVHSAAESHPPLGRTRALWLEDTELFHAEARVLAVEPIKGAAGWAIALDQTCFHPQGGGQPADMGLIKPKGGGPPFSCSMVRLDRETGVVWHEGEGSLDMPFVVGASVECEIDGARRLEAARLHSGGHLLDAAMQAAGCQLEPAKGYHFSAGPYVEYHGKLTPEEREVLLPKLQAEVERLVRQAIPTNISIDSTGLRIVDVGGVACPCGGTHVRTTADIGALKVESIKAKGKFTRVSYSIAR